MLLSKLIWLKKSQKKFPVLDQDRAGTHGEQLAHDLLQGLLQKRQGRSRLFPSLRVPKHQSAGKYEIDLLLVSEQGILGIEVKHWGGALSRSGTSWFQERNGETKSHPDPVKLNHEKLQALQQWLAERGVKVPEAALHSVVLFTNPQASFSADIKEMPEVMTLQTLPDIELTSSPMPYTQLVEALEQLPTWDRLQLHGGRVLLGDLEYIVMPDVKPSSMQRKYLQTIHVSMARGLFPGLLLQPKIVVRDWNGQVSRYPLHPEAKLVFRAAGQSTKEEIAFMHVESLELGWKDQSYYNS